MSLGKRVDGFLFLFGHLKVIKSLRLPINIFDIVNSELSYINVSAGWDFLIPCRKEKALTP
jgi:hypothetical protein